MIIQIATTSTQILGLTGDGVLMVWNTNINDWVEYKDA